MYLFIFYQSAHLTHLNLKHHDQNVPKNYADQFPYVKRGDPSSSMFKYISQFMYVDLKLILEKEPKMIPDEIRPYLHLHKKLDWFLA